MDSLENKYHKEAEHFDRLAEETGETWWGSTTPAGVERLRRRARLLAGALSAFTDPFVLELGCGTGAFSQYVLEQNPSLRLHGIDISPKTAAIAAARLQTYPRAKFRQGNALALHYAEDSADAVIGCSILHHLPMPDALIEAFHVLKPGGILWCSEPNMMNPEILLEKNVRFIGRWLQNTADETAFLRWPLARLLRETGFSKASVQPVDFMHPAAPGFLIRPLDVLGRLLEHCPLVREIAGSLIIKATK